MKATRKSGGLGYGDRVSKASQNFEGGQRWMQKIDRGTLRINPEYKDKSLDDILTDGGLNFQVYKVNNTYTSPVSGLIYPSEGYSIIRADNDVELGYGFTSGYNPISYPDILNQFFQDAIDIGNIPTRAISFKDGAVGAIQFAMPKEWLIADRPHKTFLNFYSSHNGTYGVTMNEADICIICGNTFAHSLADTSAKWTVKHTVNMFEKIHDIKEKILISTEAQEKYYFILDKTATKKVDFQMKNNFLYAMFPDGKVNEKGKINQGPANSRTELDDAISTTLNECNTAETTIYHLLQGAGRVSSYKTTPTRAKDPNEQFRYAMESKLNVNAWDWAMEAMK